MSSIKSSPLNKEVSTYWHTTHGFLWLEQTEKVILALFQGQILSLPMRLPQHVTRPEYPPSLRRHVNVEWCKDGKGQHWATDWLNNMFLVPGIYSENNIVWGVGWGGVGWDNNVSCMPTHKWCKVIYLYALLYFIQIHTYVMLRVCKFFCASTHASCYAVGSLALPHMQHATP